MSAEPEPQMLHAVECECEECQIADAASRERRIRAALNATKDFTTIGLEEITAKGLTLQLALMASAIGTESGDDHWTNHRNHVVLRKTCHLCEQLVPINEAAERLMEEERNA